MSSEMHCSSSGARRLGPTSDAENPYHGFPEKGNAESFECGMSVSLTAANTETQRELDVHSPTRDVQGKSSGSSCLRPPWQGIVEMKNHCDGIHLEFCVF